MGDGWPAGPPSPPGDAAGPEGETAAAGPEALAPAPPAPPAAAPVCLGLDVQPASDASNAALAISNGRAGGRRIRVSQGQRWFVNSPSWPAGAARRYRGQLSD